MRSRLHLAFFVFIAAVFALVAAPSVASADDPGVLVTAQAEGKIDINTASASELTQLKGIGEKKAQAIIAYREANGPFEAVDDITNVKGIGDKTLAKLRDQMTIGAGGNEGSAPTAGAAPMKAGMDAADTVPKAEPAATKAARTTKAAGGQIDINTATASELTQLKGIGEGKAQKIVEYRKANGPFKSVDDLTKVKGVGAKTVDKFRAEVTVGAAE